MNRYYLLILIIPLFSGCIITKTPGFYSGYKELDEKSKEGIIFKTDEIEVCEVLNDRKIYSITASDLLSCLKNQDTSIIYFWSPNCHSSSCILLPIAQKYCDENDYRLFIIVENYDMEIIQRQNKTTYSLYSVNHFHYKSDYCNKYIRLFKKELVNDKNIEKDEMMRRFFVFHEDKLVRTQSSLINDKK